MSKIQSLKSDVQRFQPALSFRLHLLLRDELARQVRLKKIRAGGMVHPPSIPIKSGLRKTGRTGG
jgi:hypothetical protein